MHTTKSCRGKSPSWRSATCERFPNKTLLSIFKHFFLQAVSVMAFRPLTACLLTSIIIISLPQTLTNLFGIFSISSCPQVTDGTIAPAAGSDHWHIKQAGPDRDMRAGMDVFCVCLQMNKLSTVHSRLIIMTNIHLHVRPTGMWL